MTKTKISATSFSELKNARCVRKFKTKNPQTKTLMKKQITIEHVTESYVGIVTICGDLLTHYREIADFACDFIGHNMAVLKEISIRVEGEKIIITPTWQNGVEKDRKDLYVAMMEFSIRHCFNALDNDGDVKVYNVSNGAWLEIENFFSTVPYSETFSVRRYIKERLCL